MTKKIMCVILSLMLLSMPIISIAATQSELQNQRNELQNNINQAETKIDDIKGTVSQTMKEIDKINDEISVKEDEIADITAEVNSLTTEVNKLTDELKEAQEKYDKQYDTLCTRLVAQYKNGTVSYLDVLLNSSTLTEFISMYYMIGKIAEYDTKLLDDIEEQKSTIEISKKEMEAKKEKVEEKQTQLKLEEIALTNKKSSKNRYISQLSDEEKELQKQVDDLTNQMKQKDREIAALAASSSSGGHKYTGGEIEWPVPSSFRITSTFGYRGSGATGGVGTANHNGYDIGAAHYSDIVAAEDGVVVKVVSGCTHDYPKTFSTRCYCGGGYGNYLMINHGGLTTLYGHCASINVSVGQSVTRGQKVASVGSAGWSTGYHLHFSVLNSSGTYVNPGNYLGK